MTHAGSQTSPARRTIDQPMATGLQSHETITRLLMVRFVIPTASEATIDRMRQLLAASPNATCNELARALGLSRATAYRVKQKANDREPERTIPAIAEPEDDRGRVQNPPKRRKPSE
jgi:hypothetical protein